MLKIEREKRQSLMGHTEVERRLVVRQKDSTATPLMRVIASPHGISIAGQISDQQELEKFAQMIGEAWADHKSLVPKIVSTITGH